MDNKWTIKLPVVLLCAFLIIVASQSHAATCRLIFEVVPSKNAGSIIGTSVSNRLSNKNFHQWQDFTQDEMSGFIRGFIDANFDYVTNITVVGGITIGGFEGNTSPNTILNITYDGNLAGEALGTAVEKVTAAVGYILIQDGTVSDCGNTNIGSDTLASYAITAGVGFNDEMDENTRANFAVTAYSTIVQENAFPELGYTYDGQRMTVLQTWEEPSIATMIGRANNLLNAIYEEDTRLIVSGATNIYTVYEGNDWAQFPTGAQLLTKIDERIYANVLAARNIYVLRLTNFALQ